MKRIQFAVSEDPIEDNLIQEDDGESDDENSGVNMEQMHGKQNEKTEDRPKLRRPWSASLLSVFKGNSEEVKPLHASGLDFQTASQHIASYSAQIEHFVADNKQEGDPFERAQQEKPKTKVPKIALTIIIAIPTAAWILVFICFGIDKLTENWYGRDSFTLANVLVTIFAPDTAQGRAVIEAILNTLGVVFGLLITVIGIILQLSASRFTSHVTTLFFQNITIGLFVSYCAFVNSFAFWVYLSISDSYVPRASILITLFMAITMLVSLFPFLAYLFYFLEPDKVVKEIMLSGLTGAHESINDHGRDLAKQQIRSTKAVEHLMDAANSALKRRDKNLTAEIVDALCSYFIHYGDFKSTMYRNWFKVPMWIRMSPDFLTLSEEAIRDLADRKTWMEWKILRQYQLLFGESLKPMKELCYHISMNTKIMGESAVGRMDCHTLDLCLKFMNTYLRASINLSDVRTVYNVLYQYRLLGEHIIGAASKKEAESETAAIQLESRAIRIAKYMRYYSSVCAQQKLGFLVEVISQDIREMCETAYRWNSPTHDRLLQIFLTVEDGSDGKLENVNPGVRRAQVILATTYLLSNHQEYAKRVAEELTGESPKKLWSLFKELQNISSRDFWEVSERGTNMTYLTPEQKSMLPAFFAYFEQFKIEDMPWDVHEKKKFERQQALLNFEP